MKRAMMYLPDALRVACVLALIANGCATPIVHEKWQAYDAVRRVSFAVEDVRGGRATVRWRVVSRGLPHSHGKVEITVEPADCDVVEVAVEGQELSEDSEPRWLPVDFPVKDVLSPNVDADEAPSPCQIQIDAVPWSRQSSPSFLLRYEDQTLGTLETPPPHRNAWLPVYPFAVLADGVLAIPLVLVVAIPMVPDFSWTPGKQVNWHRDESDEKREQLDKDAQLEKDQQREKDAQ